MISMEPDDRRRRAAARQNARMPTLTRLLTSYDRAYHCDPSSPDLPLPPPAPTTTLVTELRQLQAGPLPLIQVLLPHLRARRGVSEPAKRAVLLTHLIVAIERCWASYRAFLGLEITSTSPPLVSVPSFYRCVRTAR